MIKVNVFPQRTSITQLAHRQIRWRRFTRTQ